MLAASLLGPRALARPLLIRFQRGEGQILIVGLALLALGDLSITNLALRGAVLVLLLAALYTFNDCCGLEHDLRDPNKDLAFATLAVGHLRAVMSCVLTVQLVCLVASILALDTMAAVACLVVLGVNAAYSLCLKGMPGCDVACAPVWGAAYVAVAGAGQWQLLAIVGCMTTVCHLFQIRRDVAADAANGIRTISVAAPTYALAAVAASCGLLGLLLVQQAGWWIATTAAIPLLLYRLQERVAVLSNHRAWLLAKAWFALVFGSMVIDNFRRLHAAE